MNLNDFSKWAKHRSESFRIKASEAVGEMLLTAGTTVIRATPVDTGRARANWYAGEEDTPTVTTGEEDESGSVSIRRIAPVAANAKTGRTLYLFNNLPYIERLNNGHSDQAPSGFVELAVDKATEAVGKKRLLNG